MLRWLSVILRRSGYRVSVPDRQTLVYREAGRKMSIAGEMLSDGFEIYRSSVVSWDKTEGELLDNAERARILRNVKSYLEAQGERVVLS